MLEKNVPHPDYFANLSTLNAVVTGASSGIGRAIALEIARAGANVVVHFSRSREPAEHVARAIRQLGREAQTLQADFSDPAAAKRFADQAWDLSGGVDLWINNAGADLLTGPENQLSYEAKLRLLLQVDVQSALELAKSIGLRMRDARGGAVLMIGWDQADRGMEGDSGELFAAAKNAIMGFTRSLAVSLAPKVRVNCIAPGWIKTAWGETASDVWQERVLRETPLQRWGTPDDIARYARFLLSDEASFITGQVINVNGGAVR
jgi:3-oxoacyl-[acyl-carrier protein] reductase